MWPGIPDTYQNLPGLFGRYRLVYRVVLDDNVGIPVTWLRYHVYIPNTYQTRPVSSWKTPLSWYSDKYFMSNTALIDMFAIVSAVDPWCSLHLNCASTLRSHTVSTSKWTWVRADVWCLSYANLVIFFHPLTAEEKPVAAVTSSHRYQ